MMRLEVTARGRNVTFWMKGEVVLPVWGVDGDLLKCVLRARPE